MLNEAVEIVAWVLARSSTSSAALTSASVIGSRVFQSFSLALAASQPERMAGLVQHLSHMGGSLAKTVRAYNQAVGSLESRVLPTARKLESLGAGSRKPIESLQPIDQATRQITQQELTLEP